jgi:hypothetical protein
MRMIKAPQEVGTIDSDAAPSSAGWRAPGRFGKCRMQLSRGSEAIQSPSAHALTRSRTVDGADDM